MTNARVGGGDDKVSFNVQNIGQIVIDFGWKNKGFSIGSCGSYLFPTYELVDGTKIWTISRTKEALSVLSNDVEVLNVVFADVAPACAEVWSRSSEIIIFNPNDLASEYIRYSSQGIVSIVTSDDIYQQFYNLQCMPTHRFDREHIFPIQCLFVPKVQKGIIVGLQPTFSFIASYVPHLLLEQSVMVLRT